MAMRGKARTRRRAAASALVAWLVVLATATGAAEEPEQDRLRWLGVSRHIALWPLAGGGGGDAPLLVVLGEPGRSARYALDSWRTVAERQRLLVVAVSSAEGGGWRWAADGPEFLRAVVERVAAGRPVDRRRLYLFGSGPGGGFALQVALAQPRYFAAVASYGGYLPRGATGPLEPLGRGLPVLLYRALADPRTGSADLAESAAWMGELGAVVTVEEIKAPAAFERKGRKTAERIWSVLAPHRLDEAPRFTRSGRR